MRFSFHLPNPRRSTPFDADGLTDIVRAVEDSGLDAVCTSDHPFPEVRPGQAAHHCFDPFVLLGHAAAHTSRIRLVFSLLVVPYRNPFLTASMLATLDLTSGGRVVAGLGAGYSRPEFDALGASFERRGGQVAAAAAAMREAWTGEPVHREGAGWRADGNSLRPVPASPIPLWRGGNGSAAIEHAARHLDGWMPFEAPSAMAAAAATSSVTMHDVAEHVGRFLDARAEQRPDDPADVCFVRTDPRWTSDSGRATDEVGRLAEAGVTWIESGSAGRSTQEVVDDVHRLAQIAAAAGLLGAQTSDTPTRPTDA